MCRRGYRAGPSSDGRTLQKCIRQVLTSLLLSAFGREVGPRRLKQAPLVTRIVD